MNSASLEQLLRFFFRPEGRIPRVEYLLGVALVLSIGFAIVAFLWTRLDIASGLLLLASIVGLPLVIALLVLVAKRCHDIGLPGTFLLLVLVPVLGLAWLAFLALMPGNSGPNAYGPAPRFGPD